MTVGSLVGVVGTVCFDFLPISTSFRLAAKGKAAVSSSEVRQILAKKKKKLGAVAVAEACDLHAVGSGVKIDGHGAAAKQTR